MFLRKSENSSQTRRTRLAVSYNLYKLMTLGGIVCPLVKQRQHPCLHNTKHDMPYTLGRT